MTVIVRLDLDMYTLEQIRELVMMQVVTIQEVREGSSEFNRMDEYKRVMWVRNTKQARVA